MSRRKVVISPAASILRAYNERRACSALSRGVGGCGAVPVLVTFSDRVARRSLMDARLLLNSSSSMV